MTRMSVSMIWYQDEVHRSFVKIIWVIMWVVTYPWYYITEIDKDCNKVSSIILDMQKTCTEYFDQVNKANNQNKQI